MRASVWTPRRGPAECDLRGVDGDALPGVLWVDVCGDASAEELLPLLEPACRDLEREMLDELLAPDLDPTNRRWSDGAIRLASTFAVYPGVEGGEADWGRKLAPSAMALYQPVELLSSAEWLITRWHPPSLYCGSDLREARVEPAGKDEVIAAVAKRWLECGGGNAGDLGVLVMHELALTYAPAHRHFQASLEQWELRLYGVATELVDSGTGEEADDLKALWGARARLRDWLDPLNVAGLNMDVDKAWLPALNHAEVKAVDARVDKSLEELARLGDTLRSSFQLIHIEKTEARRGRDERLQRDLGFVAAGFLVPTLVVGFYGANTWIPGEHRHWGFMGMVLVMLLATAAVSWWLRRMLDADRRARRSAR